MVALTQSGKVYTWGRNNLGQLGYAPGTPYSTVAKHVAIQLPDDTGAMQDVEIVGIAAGTGHTLALSLEGQVWGWGSNVYGQRGTQDQPSSDAASVNVVPRRVVGHLGENFLENIVLISAGGDSSAAVRADGSLWTWGRNDNGQLGISTQLNQGSPSQVRKGESNAVGYYIQNVSSAAVGFDHMLAVVTIGSGSSQQQENYGWGSNYYRQLTTEAGTPVYTTTGTGSSAVTTETGRVVTDPIRLVKSYDAGTDTIVYLDNVANLFAGKYFSLSININTPNQTNSHDNTERSVYAWGINDKGQLGIGNVPGAWAAYPAAVLAGDSAMLTVGGDTDVSDNVAGQKFDDTNAHATTTGTLTEVKNLSAGYGHVSALRQDGYVWSWGDNTYHQLGTINKTTTSNNVPTLSGYRAKSYVVLSGAELEDLGGAAPGAGTDVT